MEDGKFTRLILPQKLLRFGGKDGEEVEIHANAAGRNQIKAQFDGNLL